ncbi:MAG: transcriptional regulator NrdR, partial [Lachnospiraceae bacterium]|nr:transcriptional regulator NrdR [Lachnospiraceae bacterium]
SLRDEPEIKSIEIGELVLKKLKKIDDIAYIRFASVYREFKEVENFNAEVEKIKPSKKKK